MSLAIILLLGVSRLSFCSQASQQEYYEQEITKLSAEIRSISSGEVVSAWSTLETILQENPNFAELTLIEKKTITEYLALIERSLISSGRIAPSQWASANFAIEKKLRALFKQTTNELLIHVSDPNYAGIYSSAIIQNVERLWQASKNLGGEPNSGATIDALGETLAVLHSLTTLPSEDGLTYFNKSKIHLQNMASFLSSIRIQRQVRSLPPSEISRDNLVGNLTELRIGMISGWVYSPAMPQRPLAVSFVINGSVHITKTANREVAGIPALAAIDYPYHGFELEYYAFDTGQNLVEIFVTDPVSGKKILLISSELLVEN